MPLKPTKGVLKTYPGEVLNLLGKLSVNVEYNGKHVTDTPLYVVPDLVPHFWRE